MSASGNRTYLDSLRSALHQSMQDDERVIVFGEDILDPYGGAFKVTRGLSTAFPDRVLTTPICEATIAGLAVGAALRGMRPVAEFMFGDFITLATDQIVNHAAKFAAMYNGAVTVPLVLRCPMGGGRGYGPTHSQSLERLFLGIPHIAVIAPSHVHDAGRMLQLAINDHRPVLFLENKLLYPERLAVGEESGIRREEVTDEYEYPTVLLRNYNSGESPDVTVICYGGISRLLLPVMRRCIDEEIRVLACLPGSISPLPKDAIVNAALETGKVVVIEESYAEFGWGAEVTACIASATEGRTPCTVRRLGMAPSVIPAVKHLEDQVLVSAGAIEQAIINILR